MAVGKTTTITWAWGTSAIIDFNPSLDVLDFGWFQADQFTISEVNGSVVIAIPSNNQTYTLSGVTLSELSLANINAKDSGAVSEWTTALSGSTGSSGGSTGGGDTGSGSGGSGTGGDTADPGDATSATTTVITWAWGSNKVVTFRPSIDTLDFGWFQADHFTISEVNGSVVIAIPSNNQTYTLTGVSLSELTMANIIGKDASALAEWQAALGGTGGGDTGGDTGDGDTGGGDEDDDAGYAAPWSATQVYVGGDQVSVGNLVYEANWWTQGADPTANSGAAGSGRVWTFIGYMDTTPVIPDAPDDVTAYSISDTSATLSWDAAEIDGVGTISGYQIFRDGELIATTTNTFYKVTDLTAGTTYSFTIVALDEAGASLPSDPFSFTTDSEGGSGGGDKTFSPYIDMSLTSSQNLVEMVSDAGLEAVTLAFVLSSGTDTIGWGGIGTVANDTLSNGVTIQSQVQALQAMGVEVTISFGGANGQEPALTFSSVDALVSAYQSVIDKYGVTKLDFDIEGSAIADTEANAMRNAALAELQDANPGIEVSFTLPVLTDGLTAAGVALLRDAMEAGVEISSVNIMAMDYGDYYDTGDMGDDAISAAEATLQQLDSIGLDTQLVITPMIGINDVTTEVFTLEDAQQLVDYVEANEDIAGISMWSLGRDNGDVVGYVSPVGSGIEQDQYAFSEIFGYL